MAVANFRAERLAKPALKKESATQHHEVLARSEQIHPDAGPAGFRRIDCEMVPAFACHARLDPVNGDRELPATNELR
jgi:hypothetical protein